jgi:hypothetical protein
VLVGRSEVLRPRVEKEWLAQAKLPGDQSNTFQYTVQHDRFGLPLQERILALGKPLSKDL